MSLGKKKIEQQQICINMLVGNGLNYSNLEITLSHCSFRIGFKNLGLKFLSEII